MFSSSPDSLFFRARLAVAVAVSNANGTGTLAGGFAYYPTATVTSVSPSQGSSLGGTSVTLSGVGFVANGAGASTVEFGGVPATGVSVLNDTTLQCTAPAGAQGASVDVSVSNANGTATRSGGYAYFAAPTLLSVSPGAGTALGGTSVRLAGTGFVTDGAGLNSVTTGGAAATVVVVVDDATITCRTPLGTAGAVLDRKADQHLPAPPGSGNVRRIDPALGENLARRRRRTHRRATAAGLHRLYRRHGDRRGRSRTQRSRL